MAKTGILGNLIKKEALELLLLARCKVEKINFLGKVMESDESARPGLKWASKSIESVKYGLGSLQRPISGWTKILNFRRSGPVTT